MKNNAHKTFQVLKMKALFKKEPQFWKWKHVLGLIQWYNASSVIGKTQKWCFNYWNSIWFNLKVCNSNLTYPIILPLPVSSFCCAWSNAIENAGSPSSTSLSFIFYSSFHFLSHSLWGRVCLSFDSQITCTWLTIWHWVPSGTVELIGWSSHLPSVGCSKNYYFHNFLKNHFPKLIHFFLLFYNLKKMKVKSFEMDFQGIEVLGIRLNVQIETWNLNGL